MAVVTAALVLGSRGRSVITQSTWHGLEEVWEQIGFVANSVIFILVGLKVTLDYGGHEQPTICLAWRIAIGRLYCTLCHYIWVGARDEQVGLVGSSEHWLSSRDVLGRLARRGVISARPSGNGK